MASTLVGGALPLVGGAFSLVGGVISLVGGALFLVGGAFSLKVWGVPFSLMDGGMESWAFSLGAREMEGGVFS